MLNSKLISLIDQNIDPYNGKIKEKISEFRKSIYYFDKGLINQRLDDLNNGGKFIENIDGIDFSCFLAKGNSNFLYIIYNGACHNQYDYFNNPHIPRWAYHRLVNGYVLGIDDPMYNKFKGLPLGWYYGDEKKYYLRDSLKIVEKICKKYSLNRSSCTFFSSSGGGYCALMASALWPDSLSISLNPQLYIQNHPHAKLFSKYTGIDLNIEDQYNRNAIHKVLALSLSKHVIIVNAQSDEDMENHLLPLLYNLKIKPKYGLTIAGNLLIWLYDAPGAPSPHTAFETKYIFCFINYIAQKFKYERYFNIKLYQDLCLIINEAWHDIYEKKREIYLENKDTAIDFAYIDSTNEIKAEIKKTYSDIIINTSNSNYHYYRISDFKQNSIYKIKLFDVYSNTVLKISFGMYDFKRSKIVRYVQNNIKDPIEYSFVLGNNIEGLAFCIYAGVMGKTAGHELRIGKIIIYAKTL